MLARRLTYGDHRSQFAELHLPARSQAALGVVVVLHGGFWRQGYGCELGTPLAMDLAESGFAALNVEYRRVGIGRGGGWPATFLDVAAAVDMLAGPGQGAAEGRLDLSRVVAVGHSAGGHLAAWLASRGRVPAEAPGAAPVVRLRGAVSQAGVLDLVAAADERVGGGAVPALMGGPPRKHADRYRICSPIELLPIGVPVVCVHGERDGIVPISQSERYVAAAVAAGDPAELVALPGVDHFAVINSSHPAWSICRESVARLLG